MGNIVIFTLGDTTQLVRRLKIGTPNLSFIDGDIITEAIVLEIKERSPKQIGLTTGLRREKLSNELMQDKTIELIIIDTTKADSDILAVYEKSAKMYEETRQVVRIEVTCHHPSTTTDSLKELFLISGKKFNILNDLLMKGCDTGISITDEEVGDIDKGAIAAVNSETLTLINIDTSKFKPDNHSKHTWLGTQTGYTVECIKIHPNPDEEPEVIAEEKEEEEEKTGAVVKNIHAPVKASELKTKLKKVKWAYTKWPTFMKELKEEALAEKLLVLGQEIDDDLTPKDEVVN